jgi:hypothetical protein
MAALKWLSDLKSVGIAFGRRMDRTLAGHYRCRRTIAIAAMMPQRDEDEECYAHAKRECVGKRGLTGWDSHEAREPFVEFHSMSSFRINSSSFARGFIVLPSSSDKKALRVLPANANAASTVANA